ncbi:hypothetical protein [Kitasatospora sp. NBC_01266]|uniref:hypothetical protein n=1 Tax=Kitasatospora sp. NBC_01266 TaxID=2903572 RepID=UPI002E38229A|nr:hypothetical protein [Kitasatospora sp. NBC_01266]
MPERGSAHLWSGFSKAAAQLQAAGERVELLAVLGCYPGTVVLRQDLLTGVLRAPGAPNATDPPLGAEARRVCLHSMTAPALIARPDA